MKGYIQLSMTQILSTYLKLTGRSELGILLGCTMYRPINKFDEDAGRPKAKLGMDVLLTGECGSVVG
jgi:hypothetical protein